MSQLLPPNRTELESRVASSHPLTLPVPLRTLWNPHTCPVHMLPFLAWAFSVDNWSPDWPEHIKRDVIAASHTVHRIKGTRLAVDRALEAMGVDVEITEWFETTPNLPRGTFEAVLYVNDNLAPNEPAFISETLYDELRATIDDAKNVRSHYAFKVGAKFGPNRLGAGGAVAGQALAHQSAALTYRPLNAHQRVGVASAANAQAVTLVEAPADNRVPALPGRLGITSRQQAYAFTHRYAQPHTHLAPAPAAMHAAATCQAFALTHRIMEAPA